MYIYRINDDGIKHDGFEEFNQSYIRRQAELHSDTIYFFAEAGTA